VFLQDNCDHNLTKIDYYNKISLVAYTVKKGLQFQRKEVH